MLSVESCIILLDITIVKCIGVYTKNHAVIQNVVSSGLKQFLLGVTGNIDLSKDSLHRNSNYLVQNNAGQKFLRKILNLQKPDGEYAVDLVGAIHTIEDRFMDESDK